MNSNVGVPLLCKLNVTDFLTAFDVFFATIYFRTYVKGNCKQLALSGNFPCLASFCSLSRGPFLK